MDPFGLSVALLAGVFLVWSCIEVGSNDATNLVNAVLGSRVLKRKTAVVIAGLFVVLGASFASPVMDTVRKGIFDISLLNLQMVLSVFISVYLVGTVLLYCYSLYGLPVSTTATLVFALAGASIGASANLDVVHWSKLLQILSAILVSILITGFVSFIFQRVFRGLVLKDSQKHEVILRHGPWMSGLILAALLWFMAVKGMNSVPVVASFKNVLFANLGTTGFLILIWSFFTLFTHLALSFSGKRGTQYLFHITAVLGMACMAFAFGQNDLANCASPGVTILMIWMGGLASAFKVSVPIYVLSACGFLMFLGMLTQRAQRVTRAEINTASQQNKVKLYAPKWCINLAKFFVAKQEGSQKIQSIAPKSKRDVEGKKLHYDPLRASVILSVGACVIAFASSYGLPVSTTYVAFAAVIGSGWGDQVYARGDADLKLGRTIWVITGWFLGALIAMASCVLVAAFIYQLGVLGLGLTLTANLLTRAYFKKRSDQHEKLYHLSPKSKEKQEHEAELAIKQDVALEVK